jgi:hypothetical protein
MKCGSNIKRSWGTCMYQLSVVHGYAVTAYTQALERRKTGDTDLVALWLHVGFCADRVTALQPDKARREGSFDYSSDLSSLQGIILEKLRTSQEKKMSAIKEGEWKMTQQYSLANSYFSQAAAYVFLEELANSYSAVFPGFTGVQTAVVHRGAAAYAAGECMESVVRYSADAARAAEGGPLKALWQLVLDGFEAAVAALAPWDLTLDPEHQLALGRRKDDFAQFLAITAKSLVPVVEQYDQQRALTQTSEGAAWLQETGVMLADVFKQIHESPLVAAMLGQEDADSPLLQEEEPRLTALVRAVQERLKREASEQNRTDQIIAQYLAMSNAVNKMLSPAHPHIIECWQKAALHLRYASSATPTRVGLLEMCSKVFAEIAAGTFSEAAAYFAKAQRAASKKATELWQEAAQWLLKAGLEHVKVVEETIELPPSPFHDPCQSPPAGRAWERCAYSCAAAAAVAEKGHGKGELHETEFRLCVASVRVEEHAAEFSAELTSLRTLISKALTLLRVQSEPEPHLDAPCLAHLRSVTNREETALRRLRTNWLCDVATTLSHIACQYRNSTAHSMMQAFRDALKSSRVVLNLVVGAAILSEPEFDVQVSLYEISDEPAACERQQLVCMRYIEAARTQLAGQALASAVWQKAAREEFALPYDDEGDAGADLVLQFCSALGNRLAVTAWQLGSVLGTTPTWLLSAYELPDGFPYAALVDTAAQAGLEQTTHLLKVTKKPAAVAALHKGAAVQFGWASEFTKQRVVATAHAGPTATDSHAEIAARAVQSGRRLAMAVEAQESGQGEAVRLFVRAADLSAVCSTSHAKPNPQEAQAVANKAGDRFVEAARALVAGDQPRHQAWLRAAEATAELLQVTVTKSTKRQNIALAAGYTAQKLAEADALATQAAAHPAAASTTGAAVVGSKRKVQNAPEKPQGMRA